MVDSSRAQVEEWKQSVENAQVGSTSEVEEEHVRRDDGCSLNTRCFDESTRWGGQLDGGLRYIRTKQSWNVTVEVGGTILNEPPDEELLPVRLFSAFD
jgi:hypothetical protein